MEKKIEAIELLFNSYTGEYTDGNIKAYAANVAEFSSTTINQAVKNFINGKLDRNSSFRPSSEELHKECKRIINGEPIDSNSPLSKFLTASAKNERRVAIEDRKLAERIGPFKELNALPEYKAAGKILSDKHLSPEKRLEASKKLDKMKENFLANKVVE
ncbi:MAG: hypothetical protein GY938_24375 [Ketobacter sp.]|nr:hypothetical protein [Ketobacter sp.]